MPDELCVRIGENIKRLRKSRSQITIAQLIPCSRKHYMDLEAGKVDVKILTLRKIAEALNVGITDLLG